MYKGSKKKIIHEDHYNDRLYVDDKTLYDKDCMFLILWFDYSLDKNIY